MFQVRICLTGSGGGAAIDQLALRSCDGFHIPQPKKGVPSVGHGPVGTDGRRITTMHDWVPHAPVGPMRHVVNDTVVRLNPHTLLS